MGQARTQHRKMGGNVVGVEVLDANGKLVGVVSMDRLREVSPAMDLFERLGCAEHAAAQVAEALDSTVRTSEGEGSRSRRQRMVDLLEREALAPWPGAMVLP